MKRKVNHCLVCQDIMELVQKEFDGGRINVSYFTCLNNRCSEYMKRPLQHLKKGDRVILLEMPIPSDKYLSLDYTDCLTVGNVYTVIDFYGSNIWTTSDDPNRKATFWRGRVERIHHES